MRYARLFEIDIRHTGYAGGRCDDLEIFPRTNHTDGQRALDRHRLLGRPLASGFEVRVQVERVGGELRPLLGFEALALAFELRAADHEFMAKTDLSEWPTTEMPRYVLDEGEPPQLQLEPPQRKAMLRGVAGPTAAPARKPTTVADVIAWIDLPRVPATWLAKPPTLTLSFAPRERHWVYYLLSKRAELPHIEDGDRKHPLAFTRKRLSPRNTPASVDPIGARLLQRNPGFSVHRLLSKRAIAWQRTTARRLSLYLGDELVIRELATPSPQNSNVLALANAAPRETLYRVIHY